MTLFGSYVLFRLDDKFVVVDVTTDETILCFAYHKRMKSILHTKDPMVKIGVVTDGIF